MSPGSAAGQLLKICLLLFVPGLDLTASRRGNLLNLEQIEH